MDFKVRFSENRQDFVANFEQTTIVSEGGYEEGYQKGKLEGLEEGYGVGYDNGKAERTYEIWTITLTDGTVIEKEVALL